MAGSFLSSTLYFEIESAVVAGAVQDATTPTPLLKFDSVTFDGAPGAEDAVTALMSALYAL